MTYLFFIILFLFGLGFGSFLNVVSLRFKPENRVFDFKKINGRSACPHCRKTLRWYELIPIVSFFIQAGKCRSCKHKLSWQYPIVELLSGLIFIAVPLLTTPNYHSLILNYYIIGFWLIWILVLFTLLLIALIDLKHYLIPDGLTWLLIFLGVGLLILRYLTLNHAFFEQSFLRHYSLLFTWSNNIWFNHLFAALAASTFFGSLFYFGKGKTLGGGDVKLSFALGLLLGWPDILMALMLAFLLGGAAGLILMIGRKKTMKDFLPLAPFLAIGAGLTILFGYQIINGYFAIVGL